RTSCSVLYRDDVFGYVFLGGHSEDTGHGRVRLYPADGIRQRFHFRDGRGLSVYTEGLRIESLEWDKEGDTFHIRLEKIPEEDHGSITAEARDCAVGIVRTSEGIREDNCTDGKITLETVGGTESDDGYWFDLAIRKS
ncbi:MAG: hypothetical protein K6D94_07755, partial [Clostridiales bacterium]|nr:hypothetical protein [Clostridiales bacterium]